MKTYEIKKTESGKWTITYYLNNEEQTTEHYAGINGIPVVEIWAGYSENRINL